MIPYRTIDQPEITALLFPAQKNPPSPCPASATDVCFDIGAGEVVNCRYYFVDPAAPVLVYYPATNGSTVSFDLVAEKYLNQGLNVFLASYRGCGQNGGSPSVAAMYADSEKLFHLAIKWLSDKACTGPIFVMGQSLGSTCAIETVGKNSDSVKGLIIESGISSTASFLVALGANPEQADIAEEEGFNNLEKIEEIKNPTLIFHGARDQLVPVAEAEKLQAASGARTKQFFVIPGADHHTVSKTGGDLYVKTIKQFTDTVCGVNTWRQKRKVHKRSQQGE